MPTLKHPDLKTSVPYTFVARQHIIIIYRAYRNGCAHGQIYRALAARLGRCSPTTPDAHVGSADRPASGALSGEAHARGLPAFRAARNVHSANRSCAAGTLWYRRSDGLDSRLLDQTRQQGHPPTLNETLITQHSLMWLSVSSQRLQTIVLRSAPRVWRWLWRSWSSPPP